MRDLSAFAHPEDPEVVLVTLTQKDFEPEHCWVQPLQDEGQYLAGVLLNKPAQPIAAEEGALVFFREGEDGLVAPLDELFLSLALAAWEEDPRPGTEQRLLVALLEGFVYPEGLKLLAWGGKGKERVSFESLLEGPYKAYELGSFEISEARWELLKLLKKASLHEGS